MVRNGSLAPGQVADAHGVARQQGRGGVPCAACTPLPRKCARSCWYPAAGGFLSASVCAAGDVLGKFGMESVQDESAQVQRDDAAPRADLLTCSHADGEGML